MRIEETLENLLPLLAAMATTKDIDFDHQPDFSRAYFLSSPDEAATRGLFNDRTIGCIMQFKVRYKIDAAGSHLLIDRSGILLNETEIVSFVDDAGKVLQSLTVQHGAAPHLAAKCLGPSDKCFCIPDSWQLDDV